MDMLEISQVLQRFQNLWYIEGIFIWLGGRKALKKAWTISNNSRLFVYQYNLELLVVMLTL